MSPGGVAALLAGAYLLGSVSWSYLIVKLLSGRDVRTLGSGNAGATNVMRTAGKAAGAAALALDVGKGVAAVAGARGLGAPAAAVGAAAVAVVLGHVFPVFLGFRGGKGVATAAGALGALAPLALAGALVAFVAVVLWRRYVSLGSMVAAALVPVLALAGQALGLGHTGDRAAVVSAAAISALVFWKHRTNLSRLRHGVEPRLGRLGSQPAAPSAPARPSQPSGPSEEIQR